MIETHRIYKPKTDNEFFEQLSNVVFVIGFNYKIVERRWPKIKKAFFNFDIERIVKFSGKDFENILNADGMIRNKRKIYAVIENARICKEIQFEFGSVLKWIEGLKKDKKKDPLFAPSLAESFVIFKNIGKTTSGWLDSLHNAKGRYLEYTIKK